MNEYVKMFKAKDGKKNNSKLISFHINDEK